MAAIEHAGTTPTSFDRADGLVALAQRDGDGDGHTQSVDISTMARVIVPAAYAAAALTLITFKRNDRTTGG